MSRPKPQDIKVEIEAYPTFWLHDVPSRTIQLLLKLSSTHYDGVCRQAGQQGGFIYGWNNAIGDKFSGTIRATQQQLDISCKICEMCYGLSEEELDYISSWNIRCHQAMAAANKEHWATIRLIG
jgi:hypothetical protein